MGSVIFMVDDFCCSVKYRFASSHFSRGDVDDVVDAGVVGAARWATEGCVCPPANVAFAFVFKCNISLEYMSPLTKCCGESGEEVLGCETGC